MVRLSDFVGSLRACAFFYGDPDGERRGRRTESAARQSAFLRDRIGFVMFSAGSPLGLRAPNLRQGVIDSLDSLHLIRGVGAFYAGITKTRPSPISGGRTAAARAGRVAIQTLLFMQALESGCAKWKPYCGREAVRQRALPA